MRLRDLPVSTKVAAAAWQLDWGLPVIVSRYAPPGALHVFTDRAVVHALDDEITEVRVIKAPFPVEPRWIWPARGATPKEGR